MGRGAKRLLGAALVLCAVGLVQGQQPLTPVAVEVNKKMVKLFGAGGFKGLPSYGTGILVSSKGHILTVNNHILSTTDLRVHLYDGRIYHAKVIAKEPELDAALVKIEEEVNNLPHFDFPKETTGKIAGAGDWIMAFSNQFQIATRDEPMSVQRGVIAAYTELRGRRGVFDAPFNGEVYFLDAIACNPGAAGGVITGRDGRLLGILGRELKNTLTDTWINYAVPIHAKVEIYRDEKKEIVDLGGFVRDGLEGKYRESTKKKGEGQGGYTGIVLVPNVVDSTPPFVEEIMPDSPAAKAGLRPDDLVLYVNGELINSIKMYRDIMNQIGPANEVKLEVQRGNQLKSITLKVAEHPKVKTQ